MLVHDLEGDGRVALQDVLELEAFAVPLEVAAVLEDLDFSVELDDEV